MDVVLALAVFFARGVRTVAEPLVRALCQWHGISAVLTFSAGIATAGCAGRGRKAKRSIELIRVAERCKHGIVLAAPLAVEERGRSLVARACVDLEAARSTAAQWRGAPDAHA